MKTGTVHATVVADDDLVALRRAADQLSRLAVTAPRSIMAAARAGMAFQRALDSVARRKPTIAIDKKQASG